MYLTLLAFTVIQAHLCLFCGLRRDQSLTEATRKHMFDISAKKTTTSIVI
jgi:hypothetical protein